MSTWGRFGDACASQPCLHTSIHRKPGTGQTELTYVSRQSARSLGCARVETNRSLTLIKRAGYAPCRLFRIGLHVCRLLAIGGFRAREGKGNVPSCTHQTVSIGPPSCRPCQLADLGTQQCLFDHTSYRPRQRHPHCAQLRAMIARRSRIGLARLVGVRGAIRKMLFHVLLVAASLPLGWSQDLAGEINAAIARGELGVTLATAASASPTQRRLFRPNPVFSPSGCSFFGFRIERAKRSIPRIHLKHFYCRFTKTSPNRNE